MVFIYFVLSVRIINVQLTYEEYESWFQEEILVHEKYRLSFASKSKGRVKSLVKS